MRIKKKNSIYTLIIFFLVISIGLGYSFISTTLGINGDIFVFKLQKISFANLIVKDGSIAATTEPTFRNNSTKTNFSVALTNSSDYYQFNLDVVNNTGKHVILYDIIKSGLTEEQKSKIDYNVTYIDGEEINKNDILYAESSDTITVTVKFKAGIDVSSQENLALTLSLVYEDADSSIELPKIVFKNLNVKDGSVTPNIEHVLRNNLSKTTFSITLTNPSDYYTFDLSVINNTRKNLMLKELTKTNLSEEQSSLIDYIVKYSDGKEIKIKDQLIADYDEAITVTVKFKDGITNTTSQTLKLGLSLTYEEDDGTSTSRVQNFVQMMSSSAKTDAGISFSTSSSSTAGIYFRNDTRNNEFPIYYYHGNVNNNNVMFANYCWKIVRTTETGGTKLIYNGENGYMVPTTAAISYDEYTNVSNNSTYPYTYDETTKMWSSTNITGSSSTISFNIKTAGDYVLDYYGNQGYYDYTYIYVNGSTKRTLSDNETGDVVLKNLTASTKIEIRHNESDRESTDNSISFKIGLIENSTPECNNIGETTQLSKESYFNDGPWWTETYFNHIGYMSGEPYITDERDFPTTYSVYGSINEMDIWEYEIGESAIYEDGEYHIQNAIDIEQVTDYSTLIGYYACYVHDEICENVHYIIDYEETFMDEETLEMNLYTMTIKNGEAIDDPVIVLSESITNNQDGTYTLTNPINIKKIDWYTTYNSYQNYYLCDDAISTTCGFKNQISSLSKTSITYGDGAGYIFGNDVTWDGEKYTLIDTYTISTNYDNEYEQISTRYHYTCFNDFGSCKEVYYIIESSYGWSAVYFTLHNGEDIENVKNKLFSNKEDSIIKKVLDNWYKENMLNYTSKLEDTIWCNDRSFMTGSLVDKDTGIDTRSSEIHFAVHDRINQKKPTLVCKNPNDSFSVNLANGNGALTYPVGLLTADEVLFAGMGKNSYLSSASNWWTMSPYGTYINSYWNSVSARISYVSGYGGYLSDYSMSYPEGVRPAISLLPDTKIYGGNGTSTKPYIVK